MHGLQALFCKRQTKQRLYVILWALMCCRSTENTIDDGLMKGTFINSLWCVRYLHFIIPLHGVIFLLKLRCYDDVIKWKHFPRYWPFVQGIHRSPVNSPHKGQWHRALMFCVICAQINGWVNNGEAGDLRHHHAHYDVIVMWYDFHSS